MNYAALFHFTEVRDFTRFLGHSPDTATPEELRAFQLDMKERGVGAPTFNSRLTVLSFFFAATCPRPEMKRHMRYQRAAKKIPVVLSAEEVARIIEGCVAKFPPSRRWLY
ncbi:MAG: phage integrase N-terminal SAM-like domain-containing protein [Sedimentitalea sp.]|uniref:phage integrase N-terminal SAM-like domain-containing protein n=1 Tax=Sedimentitalea sp. TaxID=2048915 RepID=UPI003299310A